MAGEQKPQGAPNTPAKPAKVNRFVALFGQPQFKAEPLKKPYVFPNGADAGTEQYGLAEVAFPAFGGIDGAAFMHARVSKRVSPDKKTITLAFSMPTVSIGPVRHPVINIKNATEAVQREYMDWQTGVLVAYKAWRADQRKSGVVDVKQSSISGGSMPLAADELEDLGLSQ